MTGKICVVTAARSEYGMMRWLIDEIYCDSELELQLIVTGSHLSEEFGNTYQEIERDGYPIALKVDMPLATDTEAGIVKSMGHCMIGMSDAFQKLQPDLVVVLGDRYELLSICSAALVMGFPIAHISGGDVTEGAIDDQVRNAITMMASLHFPGVSDSGKNIARMINSENDIYVVGEPSLDNFEKLSLMTRSELAESLGLDSAKKWVLLTQHSETKESLDNNMKMANHIVEALNGLGSDYQVIITKANADYGGRELNQYFEKVAATQPDRFKLYPSLGQLRYMSFMKEVYCVIGNSSSGIVEAPYLGVPTVNVGERQTGRFFGKSVVTASGFGDSVQSALENVLSDDCRATLNDGHYYGDGTTSIKIKDKIKEFVSKDSY